MAICCCLTMLSVTCTTVWVVVALSLISKVTAFLAILCSHARLVVAVREFVYRKIEQILLSVGIHSSLLENKTVLRQRPMSQWILSIQGMPGLKTGNILIFFTLSENAGRWWEGGRKWKAGRKILQNQNNWHLGSEGKKVFEIKSREDKVVMYPRDAILVGMEDFSGKGGALASGFSLFQQFGCWHLNLNCWVSSIHVCVCARVCAFQWSDHWTSYVTFFVCVCRSNLFFF